MPKVSHLSGREDETTLVDVPQLHPLGAIAIPPLPVVSSPVFNILFLSSFHFFILSAALQSGPQIQQLEPGSTVSFPAGPQISFVIFWAQEKCLMATILISFVGTKMSPAIKRKDRLCHYIATLWRGPADTVEVMTGLVPWNLPLPSEQIYTRARRLKWFKEQIVTVLGKTVYQIGLLNLHRILL